MNFYMDTETTGLVEFSLPSAHPSQPHMVQYAGILLDNTRRTVAAVSTLVKPDGWTIPERLTAIHGITTEMAEKYGRPLAEVLDIHTRLYNLADLIVGHNISFDMRIVRIQHRKQGTVYNGMNDATKKPTFCTMHKSRAITKLPYPSGGSGFKQPRLDELHMHFFGSKVEGAHDALEDVRATVRCHHKLEAMGV